MSTPWGGIGAWAAEAERAEVEELKAVAAVASVESQSFPSLKEAVSTKPKKKKKMSLSEFKKTNYSFPGIGGLTSDYQDLTSDEMLRLPTGPKERAAEEMHYNRMGGGFSSYGWFGPSLGRMRDHDDNNGSWGERRRSYGGFDEERKGPPPRVSESDQPSKADEVNNWASVKKALPSIDSGWQNRYVSLCGGSRADDMDNWAIGKKPLPAKSSTFGSGFHDLGKEPDRWTRGTLPCDSERERPRLTLDQPKGDAGVNESIKTNKPNPFGAARPREEVLAKKGLDWKKLDSEIDAKRTSRPTSAHSSRPSSAQSSRSEDPGLQGIETVAKPRPRVNPFGDAKPREVLLEERGNDWQKIDLELEHRAIDREETEREKLLKKEIDNLKKESKINSNKESVRKIDANQTSLRSLLLEKEKQLELLIHDLDDKVRFGQKVVERLGSRAGKPGSGARRTVGFSDRLPSRTSSIDDSISVEFMDRPRSHGTGDAWMRPGDDRRPFQDGRDKRFRGSRDLDRPRKRW